MFAACIKLAYFQYFLTESSRQDDVQGIKPVEQTEE